MKPKISSGIDIIEVDRFRRKPIGKNINFYNSLFTKSELIHCKKYSDIYPHLAGIFAAKEAVVKCIDIPLRILDIEISWYENGKPFAMIDHKDIVQISISHTKSLAIAIAVSLS